MCLFTLFTALAVTLPSAALWQEGLGALSNDPAVAVEKFEAWIAEANDNGKASAQAHYNLGVSHWKNQQADLAAAELLKAASLRNYPWLAWNDFETLADMQRELGIQESPIRDFSVRWAAVSSGNLLLLLACIAFWSLCAYVYFKGLKKPSPLSPLLLTMAIIFGSLSLLSVANRKVAGHLAVLRGTNSITVMETADGNGSKEAPKLIELPPGTLVILDDKKNHYFKLRAPVPGWVEDYAVIP